MRAMSLIYLMIKCMLHNLVVSNIFIFPELKNELVDILFIYSNNDVDVEITFFIAESLLFVESV
jgi:hypothetical protein